MYCRNTSWKLVQNQYIGRIWYSMLYHKQKLNFVAQERKQRTHAHTMTQHIAFSSIAATTTATVAEPVVAISSSGGGDVG